MDAAELLNRLYGGRLIASSSGFLTSIEFFGILGGVYSNANSDDGSKDISELILPHETKFPTITTKLNSTDFARRYAWEPKGRDALLKINPEEVFEDDLQDLQNAKHEPLKGLVRALAIPQKPGTKKDRTWTTAYLYPYSRELMHWDVRRAKGLDPAVGVERNNIRGAGALVHKILRSDSDQKRLQRIRGNFRKILEPTLATDSLFASFNDRNLGSSEYNDGVEREARRKGVESEDLLCRMVDNILDNPHLDKYTKVNHLMHLMPLSVMMHALRVARKIEGTGTSPFFSSVVDFGFGSSQLRRESKSSLQRAKKDCESAIDSLVEKELIPAESNEEEREKFNHLAETAKKQRGWGNYYGLTAAEIGFLNASTGSQYHVIKDSLLEALVAAELDRGQNEMTLRQFCRKLFENWGMVIDKESAQKVELLERMNGESFEINEKEHFTKPLRRLGLLREFSDQTQMVGLPE